MIAFLNEKPMPPNNQHARNLLLIARARLLEAEDWLRQQDEGRGSYQTRDYDCIARRELRGAIQLAAEADRTLTRQ